MSNAQKLAEELVSAYLSGSSRIHSGRPAGFISTASTRTQSGLLEDEVNQLIVNKLMEIAVIQVNQCLQKNVNWKPTDVFKIALNNQLRGVYLLDSDGRKIAKSLHEEIVQTHGSQSQPEGCISIGECAAKAGMGRTTIANALRNAGSQGITGLTVLDSFKRNKILITPKGQKYLKEYFEQRAQDSAKTTPEETRHSITETLNTTNKVMLITIAAYFLDEPERNKLLTGDIIITPPVKNRSSIITEPLLSEVQYKFLGKWSSPASVNKECFDDALEFVKGQLLNRTRHKWSDTTQYNSELKLDKDKMEGPKPTFENLLELQKSFIGGYADVCLSSPPTIKTKAGGHSL
ncbi:MAG: hypothetical protein ABL857_04225 [Rickettsiales bacterium]